MEGLVESKSQASSANANMCAMGCRTSAPEKQASLSGSRASDNSKDSTWCIISSRITLETGKDGKPLKLGSGTVYSDQHLQHCQAMLTSATEAAGLA